MGIPLAYATDALRRSREGIVDPSDTSAYVTASAHADFPTYNKHAAQDLKNRLKHWDQWVIPYIVVPGLLSAISYSGASNRHDLTLHVGGKPALELVRPSTKQFLHELPDVLADAQLREDRAAEILMQTADTASFWATVLPITADKTPATWMLMSIGQQLALSVEMMFKHVFACARPVEYSPEVQPMIPTPGHGTYPMGHGCEATVTAHLLAELTRPTKPHAAWHALKEQLDALALRIAENRIVAGVHFETDLKAGASLGDTLAAYLIACCKHPDGEWHVKSRQFDPATGKTHEHGGTGPKVRLPDNAALAAIWHDALAEWAWMR